MPADERKDEAEKLREQREKEIRDSFAELETYKKSRLKLQHPTFFVPGWTGEDCAAWRVQYPGIQKKFREFFLPVEYWIGGIIENPEYAEFINFEEETEGVSSFMEFGSILKKKIRKKLEKFSPEDGSEINLVGHSMGGLDSRAAILDREGPLFNAKNLITVGTPNNGNRFVRLVVKIKKYPKHHKEQCLSMHPDSEAMKLANSPESKVVLLNGMERFYVFMGLRDMVAGRSPKLSKEGIPAKLYEEKVRIIQTTSAEHTDRNGITQDPRVVLPVIKLLCGIELKSSGNKGYVFRRT